jgi:hypothetical protein
LQIPPRFRWIARQLQPYQLQYAHEEELLTPSDLEALWDTENRPPQQFLGYYSPKGLAYALKRYGVFRALAQRGFSEVELHLDLSQAYSQRLSIYDHHIDEAHLLHEMVVKRKRLHFHEHERFPMLAGHHLTVMSLEWMCLQNPRIGFAHPYAGLPGQKHPGLGLGRWVASLLKISAQRLKLDGMMSVPSYAHNAAMYAPAFQFLDPVDEGRFQALMRDVVTPFGLHHAAWGVHLGYVYEDTQPFRWYHSEQFLPLCPALKAHFASAHYQAEMQARRDHSHFYLDQQALEAHFAGTDRQDL